jgi:xanthosine utilization system XapX-like protein
MVSADSRSGRHLRQLAVVVLASSALLCVGVMSAAVAVVMASTVAALTGMIAILVGGSVIIALWRRNPTVFSRAWDQVITQGPNRLLRLSAGLVRRATLGDLVSVFRRRYVRPTSIGPAGATFERPATDPWMQIFRAWRAHTKVHLELAGKAATD